MEKKILLICLLFLLLSSCTLPSIIILKDPLTDKEHVDLGYIYERQGKLELAKKEYKKAIGKNKKLWQAYFNLGNVYAKMWEFEKAEEAYRKALYLNKNDPDTLNNLAYVLYKQGRKEEGLEYINKALRIREKQEYLETKRALESKW